MKKHKKKIEVGESPISPTGAHWRQGERSGAVGGEAVGKAVKQES